MQITYNNAQQSVITKEYDPVALRATKEIIAPVMCDFMGWVLQCAKASGLKRLYFLARDGWIMYNTATVIAEKNGLDIELKYLYCSRISLRNAALKMLGRQESYRYLLEGGFTLTPKVILSRLQLTDDERQKVYNDIGFSLDEDVEMGKAAAAEFCGKLRGSQVYNSFIDAVSDRCRERAIGYLQQEGLLEDTPYGIVDSGWTGSMQRMLCILTGKKQKGFYFGLYAKPDTEYGEYLPYLFDKSTSPLLVSRFNNNLFETLCSAPHGMTAGYKAAGNGVYEPILKNDSDFSPYFLNKDMLMTQRQELLRFAGEDFRLSENVSDIKERRRFAFSLLDKLMYRPDEEIAKAYGGLRFSDDPSELYSFPLASRTDNCKRLYFLPRLVEKFLHKGEIKQPIYWSYGTAVLSGKGRFCRANLRLWEILWLMKR
ncbi:MAG: hypothetical protein HDT44_03040 [Ruminococcaceae bacterium]|nr:hypothetical protein [Oscillospiraceae bacterium]